MNKFIERKKRELLHTNNQSGLAIGSLLVYNTKVDIILKYGGSKTESERSSAIFYCKEYLGRSVRWS